MRIESLQLKNFKAFRDVEIRDIPPFCVLVGANGSGKSTLLNALKLVQDALAENMSIAASRLGGVRGIDEVLSRGAEGVMEIVLQTKERPNAAVIGYLVRVSSANGTPIVERERVAIAPSSAGEKSEHLDVVRGHLTAFEVGGASLEKINSFNLKSTDALALKSFGQFAGFLILKSLSTFIESWSFSNLQIDRVRPEREFGLAEHLSPEGDNLALVLDYYAKKHPAVLETIIQRLRERVPGIDRIETKSTEDGRLLLRFHDGAFEDPFLARQVSDGTIKMLAYLTLLYDPNPAPLLCIEEPENHLYPKLLAELAEEFRAYALRGGQVIVTTHSPDFLNAAELDEVFWLAKENGATKVVRARDDEQVATYMRDGDKLGSLWRQGFFTGADPG